MKKNKLTGIVFLILFFISLIFCVSNTNLNIPLFNSKNADIRANFKTDKDVKFFINDFEIKNTYNYANNSYKTFAIDNYPIYKISYTGGDIDNIVLSVGHNLYYYNKNDIKNFKKDEKGNFLIKDVKYYKNSKYITDKGNLHRFFISFLSVFYNPFSFILPIFCLIMAILNLNFTISKNMALLLILIIAFLLRISDLSPFYWTDELYTVYMAGNPNLPLISAFSDAGNPPLFFILSKIWMKLFGISPEITRILPSIFSFLSVIFIYKFVKNKNENLALICAFLLSINIYSLISAKELRCYSLCILFSILLGYYLFKLYKNPSNKNFIIYFLICALSFNTHYFMSFLIFSNFILGIFILKDKIKFLIANSLSFMAFLPFLIMTGVNKGLVDETFNNLPFPDFNFYKNTLYHFIGAGLTVLIIIFGIILIFKYKKIKNNNVTLLILYSYYSIISVFVLSYLFSYIKPICTEYYFIILLPFFIILPLCFCFIEGKYQKFIVILILIAYFLPHSYILRDKTRLLIFDNIVSYYKNNSKDNSALIIPHSKEMLIRAYGLKEDEIIVNSEIQSAENLIKIIENSDKKTFYFKLEYKNLNEFLSQIKRKHNIISLVRCDKDVILAKVIKRQNEIKE